MKKITRNIVVDNKKYVYWYSMGERCTSITISPFEDKTIKVCYEFENPDKKSDEDDGPYFLRMSKIIAKKNQEIVEISLVMPRMIAQLVQITIKKIPDIFITRNKVTTFKNAYTFLEEMGYEDLQPMWEVTLW